jgi:predicted DNA-binding protein (MmcQ/YjbR family)
MNIEEIREYCLKKNNVTEEFPFGETTLVFKTGGKMFLLASLDSVPLRINLKCNPEKAAELRERYDAVEPAYHMNKIHWNSVTMESSISRNEIFEWIDHSYDLITAKQGKSKRKK